MWGSFCSVFFSTRPGAVAHRREMHKIFIAQEIGCARTARCAAYDSQPPLVETAKRSAVIGDHHQPSHHRDVVEARPVNRSVRGLGGNAVAAKVFLLLIAQRSEINGARLVRREFHVR